MGVHRFFAKLIIMFSFSLKIIVMFSFSLKIIYNFYVSICVKSRAESFNILVVSLKTSNQPAWRRIEKVCLKINSIY